jgi:hypothetical protein
MKLIMERVICWRIETVWLRGTSSAIAAKVSSPVAKVLALLFTSLLLATPVCAAPCGGDFNGFLAPMARDAQSQGISRGVIDTAFAGVTLDPAVLAFDRRQHGTFRQSFERYAATRVTPARIKRAKILSKLCRKVLCWRSSCPPPHTGDISGGSRRPSSFGSRSRFLFYEQSARKSPANQGAKRTLDARWPGVGETTRPMAPSAVGRHARLFPLISPIAARRQQQTVECSSERLVRSRAPYSSGSVFVAGCS